MAKWLTLGLVAVVAGAWVFAFMAQIPQGGIRELLYSALLLLTCVLALGGAVACLAWKQGMTRRNTGLVCLTVALTSLSLALLGQQLRATSVPVHVAAQLGTIPADMILHGCGYTEPSLVFYTNHQWMFTDDVSAAKQLLQSSDHVAMVVLKREWTLDRWFKRNAGNYSERRGRQGSYCNHPRPGSCFTPACRARGSKASISRALVGRKFCSSSSARRCTPHAAHNESKRNPKDQREQDRSQHVAGMVAVVLHA